MSGARLTQAIEEAWSQQIGPQFAGMVGAAGLAAMTGAKPAASAPTGAPAPPPRKNAVIYGLDDGPREVQLGPKP